MAWRAGTPIAQRFSEYIPERLSRLFASHEIEEPLHQPPKNEGGRKCHEVRANPKPARVYDLESVGGGEAFYVAWRTVVVIGGKAVVPFSLVRIDCVQHPLLKCLR